MNIQDTMREILRAESEAILNIPVTDAYTRAVELIVDHVAGAEASWSPQEWASADR